MVLRKATWVSIFTFAVVSLSLSSNAKAADAALAERLCLRTAHQYFVGWDTRSAERVMDMFTDDATLDLQSRTAAGADEIGELVKSSPENRKTMHHLTTYLIEPTGKMSASGTIYVLLNILQPAEDGTIQQALVSAIYRDKYVLNGEECKISSRRLESRIVNQTAPFSQTR